MGNNSSRQDAYKVKGGGFHEEKQQKCNLDECQQKIMEILADSDRKQEKQQLFKLLAVFNLQDIIDTKLGIIRDVRGIINSHPDCEQEVKDVCLKKLCEIEDPEYILSTTLDDIKIDNLLKCCEINRRAQTGKSICNLIGKGSFGRVYENPKGKEEVVYKVFINEENSREEIAFNSFFKNNNNNNNEMEKYALLGVTVTDLPCEIQGEHGNKFIKIQKCTKILRDYLDTELAYKKNLLLKFDIITKLCDCVEGFHTASGGYCHNDIKPDNICVTHSEDTTDTTRVQNVKLIDFGTCSKETSILGSLQYAHPMHIFKMDMDNKCTDNVDNYETDWWSVGLVCYEIYNDGIHFFKKAIEHSRGNPLQISMYFMTVYTKYVALDDKGSRCTYKDITVLLREELKQNFVLESTTPCEKIKELFRNLIVMNRY